MPKPPANPNEQECPACNGTGYPVVMQPVQPGRKIYPAPCKKCCGSFYGTKIEQTKKPLDETNHLVASYKKLLQRKLPTREG